MLGGQLLAVDGVFHVSAECLTGIDLAILSV